MGKNDYWCLVKSVLVMIFEIQIGLVRTITNYTIIIDTTAQALGEEILPGKFRGNVIPKRKRIAIEGNTGCRQTRTGRRMTIASGGEFVRLWAPAEFPINSAPSR